MHDGDYRNMVGPQLVDDCKRKPLGEPPSNGGARDETSSARTSRDLGQCAFNLVDKVRTQAGCARFVEPGRGDQFAFGLRVESERHRSAARAFLNTFAAGTPLTLPLFSSTERRSISSSYAPSAPGSAVSSRLLINRSASRARERGESFSASSSIFLRAVDIALPCRKI